MPMRLLEVCRAGSACKRILAHPDDETVSPEIYRPQDTHTDGGLADLFTLAQSFTLIAIGVLAAVLFAVTTWHNRREAREEKRRRRLRQMPGLHDCPRNDSRARLPDATPSRSHSGYGLLIRHR
ncbi:hypothetical protein ACFRR7_17520 [Streptomyces sp. NPDC056909]|uniref:hypothetical protein n=1 Tax=Streptomyces sp. NPDC056909 TaxID=3345963 RepID=UPI0036B714DB